MPAAGSYCDEGLGGPPSRPPLTRRLVLASVLEPTHIDLGGYAWARLRRELADGGSTFEPVSANPDMLVETPSGLYAGRINGVALYVRTDVPPNGIRVNTQVPGALT